MTHYLSPKESPFTTNPADSIAYYGEARLIEMIKGWLAEATPQAPEGMGDDCAVLSSRSASCNLITTDSLVYGCHFDGRISARTVGAKLLKRSLSDIAAMGGAPDSAVVALMLPAATRVDWLAHFYEGLKETAARYKVAVVGGDLSKTSNDWVAALTLTGHAERPLTRAGAAVGHELWVTGTLGGSIYGKHYTFPPRIEEGQWLAQQGVVTAMMDLTDGLVKDLPALVPDGCVALLDVEALPVSDAAYSLTRVSGFTPRQHAFSDGEDYELLFTTTPLAEAEEDFLDQWNDHHYVSLRKIGWIEKKRADDAALVLDSETRQSIYAPKGFDHFSPGVER